VSRKGMLPENWEESHWNSSVKRGVRWREKLLKSLLEQSVGRRARNKCDTKDLLLKQKDSCS